MQAQSTGWLHVLIAIEILVDGNLKANEHPEAANRIEVHTWRRRQKRTPSIVHGASQSVAGGGGLVDPGVAAI